MLTGLFKIFFIAIVMDLVTGIIAAGYEGRIKSATMRRGLWTTMGEVVALAFMTSVCTIMPELLQMAEFVISAMLFKEGVSICENLGRAGLWIPPWMKRALEVFSDDIDNNIPTNIKDKIKKK